MKIVFAMAGNGHRFQKKGHQGPKPLINIEGRPMVEHISKMFPNESDVILFVSQSI